MSEQLIFGRNAFNEALKMRKILKAYTLADSPYLKILTAEKIAYQICKRKKLDELAQGENHQGIIAVIEAYQLFALKDILKKENGLIVMLDGLEDPHNLGAIMRTVDAVGADGIIYRKHHNVALTATVAKVSTGAIEHVKTVEVTNLITTVKELKKEGYWIVGTDSKATQYYNEIDYRMNTVLVIGSEGKGISKLLAEACDYLVKIPLYGHVNSLNASVAAGIMLYTIRAQRE